MNKIISIILTIAILLSMPAFSVNAASASLLITTPANGSTIENADTDIVVTGADTASDLIYEFDGKSLEGVKLTKDMLTIGEHTLTVYSIDGSGAVSSDTSVFKVQKSIYNPKLNKNFNDMASGYVADASTIILYGDYNFKTADYRITFATRWKAKPDAYYGRVSAAVGPQSASDGAANITSAVGSTKGATSLPSINVQLAPASAISTVGSFEFDLKMNPSTYIIFNAIGESSVFLKNDNTLRLFDNYSVESPGKILASSVNTYDPSKWQHVKFDIEPTAACTKFKLEVSEKDAQGNWVVHTTITDSTTNSIGERIDGFRMYYGGGNGMGITIDNVKASEAPTYTGIKKLEYMYDAQVTSDANPDSSRLTGLKVYMNETVKSAVPVTLTDKSGVSFDVTNTTVDTASNAIVATLSAEQSLAANTEYNVSVSLAAHYSGLTDFATKAFKTSADAYAANEPEFTIDGVKLLTVKQLSGKPLTAKVKIDNVGEAKPMALVLAVRNQNKLVGLDIVIPSGGIPDGGATYTLQTGELPADLTQPTVQLMFLNDINNISTAFPTVVKTLN